MNQTDLVIVGGSFAGLSCAESAASQGLNTIVLDRKIDAGAIPHTTGILVKEVADEWDIPSRLCRKITRVKLYSPCLRSITLHRPDYYFLATDTPALMRWMAQRAVDVGAQIRFGQAFKHASITHHGVSLPEHKLVSRYMVGADGPNSRVARNFGLSQNKHFLMGVEAEFTGVNGLDEDCMHVFIDTDLAPGYVAWALPGMGITQVGIATRRPAIPELSRLIQRLSSVFDFSQAQQVGQRAGLIPCGGPLSDVSRERLMLLGDAAGMVSPLTAGGIQPAMHLGNLAGSAITDYLQNDIGMPVKDPYKVVKAATPRYVTKRVLRKSFDTLPISNKLIDVAFDSHWFRKLAQTVFFHHRGLLSMQAWSDLLRPIER